MYIAPNSKIYILKDVPLDPTYDHTIFWNTSNGISAAKTAQSQYFASKAKYTLTAQSYQRLQRGWVRVEVLSDNLYDCNYLMFQNTSFGTKWFYAFIKKVEYINNNVSEIEFEIDEMQTWYFDYDLEPCFVEREHSTGDSYEDWIIDENLDIGDEYITDGSATVDMNDMSICILANKTTKAPDPPSGISVASGRFINNIYEGCRVIAGIPIDGTTSALNAIEYYLNPDHLLPDEIISVYQYPSIFGDAGTTTPVTTEHIFWKPTINIDGYTPKNMKLQAYPYRQLLVVNNCGQCSVYRWEDWDAIQSAQYGKAIFNLTGVFVSTPCALLYPKYYNGMTNAYAKGITYSNFPQCAWEGDVYKAWLAQNKTSLQAGVISGAMTAGLAVAGAFIPPLAMLAVPSAIHGSAQIFNTVAKAKDMEHTPNETRGQVQTDSLNPGMGRVQFDIYSQTIKAPYAKIIDDYFTRYGYATKRNKIPNRNARQHWTYTKTLNCTIKGSIPADSARKICDVYNNGITFWNNPAEIGDYSFSNDIWMP